jgi:hypothetical protein
VIPASPPASWRRSSASSSMCSPLPSMSEGSCGRTRAIFGWTLRHWLPSSTSKVDLPRPAPSHRPRSGRRRLSSTGRRSALVLQTRSAGPCRHPGTARVRPIPNHGQDSGRLPHAGSSRPNVSPSTSPPRFPKNPILRRCRLVNRHGRHRSSAHPHRHPVPCPRLRPRSLHVSRRMTNASGWHSRSPALPRWAVRLHKGVHACLPSPPAASSCSSGRWVSACGSPAAEMMGTPPRAMTPRPPPASRAPPPSSAARRRSLGRAAHRLRRPAPDPRQPPGA